ncbi:unnamed protein product [Clonostachys solani]|uniref:Allantoin permease n=1 Tax=Clonostachys solani TaxID=160281 RepID=A0A9N9W918_9HYPO|nr:unnamed protein product [Clonostachys solani]
MTIPGYDGVVEKLTSVKNAFSSWDNFKHAVQVKNTFFSTYCIFWFGLAFGNWSLGSAMIGIGLNWWQAIVVIFVSQMIAAIAMAFNSRAATTYHLGYPAISRVVFGMQMIVYSGASHVANMLRAIFGDSYKNMPNHLPASAGIATNKMIAFFIFWLIHLGFCFFRPYQLTKFFWFKGFIMVPAVFGVFIYCMIETGGQVNHTLPQTSATTGMGWFIIQAINTGMGNLGGDADLVQQLVKPITCTLAASLGILATAAINGKWGLTLWNPWDLLDAIQDRHNGSGPRFAIFLAAFTWMVGILGTNIAANMIAFGSDVSLIAPRYIDMKRGFFLAQVLAYAIVPWKIMSSAKTFTSFLSGYGLFMASVAAIMIADYFITTRGNIKLAWLFDPQKTNKYYRYHKGINLQAVIAYLIGIALPLPGFLSSLGVSGVGVAGKRLFSLGWLLSFFVSFISYPLICKFWPTENQKLFREEGLAWEESSKTTIEGVDIGNSPDGIFPEVEKVIKEEA